MSFDNEYKTISTFNCVPNNHKYGGTDYDVKAKCDGVKYDKLNNGYDSQYKKIDKLNCTKNNSKYKQSYTNTKCHKN